MSDDASDFSPQKIRELLHRKALATERYRIGVARQLGLNESEGLALSHLAHHGRLTPGELGELMYLTSGGVTALLHRLERAGHIRREPHPHDKRSSFITATPEILAAANEVYDPHIGRLDEASTELTPEQRRIVGRYLKRVVAVSEDEAARAARGAEQPPDNGPGMPDPGLWT